MLSSYTRYRVTFPSGEPDLDVRWSYQALPPAEPQLRLPLLPNPDAPKTRAFISQAKYPRSRQSLSLLALRQSDNYLVSFPLPSGQQGSVLTCITLHEILSEYCTFLYPTARDTGNMESQRPWLTGVCLSSPSENSCFVLELQRRFWRKEERDRVMCTKALLLCLTAPAIISGQYCYALHP